MERDLSLLTPKELLTRARQEQPVALGLIEVATDIQLVFEELPSFGEDAQCVPAAWAHKAEGLTDLVARVATTHELVRFTEEFLHKRHGKLVDRHGRQPFRTPNTVQVR